MKKAGCSQWRRSAVICVPEQRTGKWSKSAHYAHTMCAKITASHQYYVTIACKTATTISAWKSENQTDYSNTTCCLTILATQQVQWRSSRANAGKRSKWYETFTDVNTGKKPSQNSPQKITHPSVTLLTDTLVEEEIDDQPDTTDIPVNTEIPDITVTNTSGVWFAGIKICNNSSNKSTNWLFCSKSGQKECWKNILSYPYYLIILSLVMFGSITLHIRMLWLQHFNLIFHIDIYKILYFMCFIQVSVGKFANCVLI